jgi:tripartite-type tricarboxylate transporter receptor subunit TctC
MRQLKHCARIIVLSLVGIFAVTAAPALAQSWPQRTVRLIVPLGPGSATDLSARLVADRLAERWGRPVVIENRPGAEGIAAITGFVGTRDDHTLLYSPSAPVTLNPLTHQKLPYDPVRNLVPICSVVDAFIGIASPAALKLTSLDDLVKTARAQPGKLNWAAAAVAAHFVFAGFVKGAGLEMAQVPYRDITHALHDLAEARIQVMTSALPILLPQVQAGRVKLLAVTNRERAAIAPEVPTAVEAGYPALALDPLFGLFGPRDMPNDLRERIAADVRAVVADAALAGRFTGMGLIVHTGTPAEFAARIEKERTSMAAIAKAIGATPAQ